MNYLKFKTNINCGGCVANVTPFLNKEAGICKWNVDTTNAQKVLTISTDKLSEEEVIKIIQEAGYKAERL
ncbi:heavy-metal-associated domain-containing protein [Adhaeribacter soli]|uniref:Heavy-metal-associated domain-containing protein n=1 Tax=Adhaeribacter soli TaxID=2607655 RepID=A0A5N1J2Y6_9BACT|nr:heavy-metal-associated domain-containing protein [Adhaeribacter soli]KAA9340126.1 heavy-metal-associated domain-containing protein [Adhaeribacter soli]